MKPFRLGDKEWRKATVTSRLVERSYTVESPEGDTYRRNRVHLKKTQETPSEPTDNSDTNEHGGAQKKRYASRTWFSKTHKKNRRSQWKSEGILSCKEHDHISNLETTTNQETSLQDYNIRTRGQTLVIIEGQTKEKKKKKKKNNN